MKEPQRKEKKEKKTEKRKKKKEMREHVYTEKVMETRHVFQSQGYCCRLKT